MTVRHCVAAIALALTMTAALSQPALAAAPSTAVITETGVSWQGPPVRIGVIQRWVPGDVATTEFVVRNELGGPVAVDLVARVDGDPRFTDALTILVRTADGHRLAPGPTPTRIADLGVGEQAQLAVSAELSAEAANYLQRLDAAVDLRLLAASPGPRKPAASAPSTESGTAAGLGPRNDLPGKPGPAGKGRDSSPSRGRLASSGAEISLAMIIAAGLACAAGAALVGRSTRRTRKDR